MSRRWALGPLSHSPRWDLDAASREDENEEAGCVRLGQHRLPLGCAVVQHRRLDAEDEAQAHLDGDGGLQGEESFQSHPEARGVNGDSEVQHAEHRAKTDRRVCADGSTGCGSLGQHRLPFGADPIQEGNSQAGTGSKLRGQGRLQHEEHRAETDRRVYADGSTGCGSCGQHRLPSEAEVQVGAGGLSRRWAPGSLSHSPPGGLAVRLGGGAVELRDGPRPTASWVWVWDACLWPTASWVWVWDAWWGPTASWVWVWVRRKCEACHERTAPADRGSEPWFGRRSCGRTPCACEADGSA